MAYIPKKLRETKEQAALSFNNKAIVPSDPKPEGNLVLNVRVQKLSNGSECTIATYSKQPLE
jgi:hypothetical protein